MNARSSTLRLAIFGLLLSRAPRSVRVIAFMALGVLLAVAVIVLAVSAHGEPLRVPRQYQGAWCATKWHTIFRRCETEAEGLAFEIERTFWGTDDQGCTLTAIRKSRYGGHRVTGRCTHADSGKPDWIAEERWWLGSHGTRLQVVTQVGE
jgi:hypothetical protein